jgi:hypothetical protein
MLEVVNNLMNIGPMEVFVSKEKHFGKWFHLDLE